VAGTSNRHKDQPAYLRFSAGIVSSNPSLKVFLNGWIKRAESLRVVMGGWSFCYCYGVQVSACGGKEAIIKFALK